jgi:transcriptional regulator with XRE-family HTH domain
MEIKITLKAARVNAGLTQVEAARAVHRNKQTIINWEAGHTRITAADLQALADIYGIPAENIRIPDKGES